MVLAATLETLLFSYTNLKSYTSIADAKRSLVYYFGFYNERRRHQALDAQTPNKVYYQAACVRAA